MSLSIFDLFKIGIGPSSSHTVGPMWAGYRFVEQLRARGLLHRVRTVRAWLYGSLALTGAGHATDKAVILGLMGQTPDTIDADEADHMFQRVQRTELIMLGGEISLPFANNIHLVWEFGKSLPEHPNGLVFRVEDENDETLFEQVYFSTGGGFIATREELAGTEAPVTGGHNLAQPYPFSSAAELLEQGDKAGLSIAEVAMANELARSDEAEINAGLDRIAAVMESCVDRGMRMEGILPGGLNVKRRAPELHARLMAKSKGMNPDPLVVMDWVNLYALAVNEENAAGGRVVTAPTNGAAGVIPAVLSYYRHMVPGATQQGVRTFLTTCAAIGMLYKTNASISAAEVGCQGEVGVACSMAAGGLTAVLGGSNLQIENAAEIGMEHNLGLTCDPIGGLVQVPCIERNTMGAIKAINAARLALASDGQHIVTLDEVIQTMYETGKDMSEHYKETALAGLAKRFDGRLAAVSVATVEC